HSWLAVRIADGRQPGASRSGVVLDGICVPSGDVTLWGAGKSVVLGAERRERCAGRSTLARFGHPNRVRGRTLARNGWLSGRLAAGALHAPQVGRLVFTRPPGPSSRWRP